LLENGSVLKGLTEHSPRGFLLPEHQPPGFLRTAGVGAALGWRSSRWAYVPEIERQSPPLRTNRTAHWWFRQYPCILVSKIDHQSAARYDLPAMYCYRCHVRIGGLISYG
jgi:hypothetical protein